MNVLTFHRLIKILILSLMAGMVILPLSAAFIQPDAAVNAAKTWLKRGPAGSKSVAAIAEMLSFDNGSFLPSVVSYPESAADLPALYLIKLADGGFVLVSADDNSVPILAYSADNGDIPHSYPPAFVEWVGIYEAEINEIRNSNLDIPENRQLWLNLGNGEVNQDYKLNRSVQPLVVTNWDQGWPYNELCPADAQGPGGRVYAGCVATAMGMVMKYWNHPNTGVGNNSYYAPGYGYQSANFGATTYQWEQMPNALGGSNIPVATLLYHCGVAVNMGYSPDGSGAQSTDAASAMVDHFRYPNAEIHNKSSYSTTNWNNLLKAQIDNGSPMYYSGSAPGGGHAFVLDGYDAADYFHFNFGWSGAFNGYYYASNINPGGSAFNQYQSAIINSIPENYTIANTKVRMRAINATVGEEFTLTVTTNPILGSWDVNHYEFELNYDADFMEFTGASVSNTVASGGTLSAVVSSPGVITVTWNGSTDLIGGGDLATFYFMPIDAGEFLFDITGMKYNTNSVTNTMFLMVPVQAPIATLAQSQITMLNVMHLGYQQIGTTEIRTTYLLPSWNVTHYQFNLSYDPSKLEFVGVEAMGTLSAGLEPQVVINTPGSVSISCDSTNPITGSGTLLKLMFLAIGNTSSLSVTQVSANSFYFNTTQITSVGSANFILSAYTSVDDELVQTAPTMQIYPNPIHGSASIVLNSKLPVETSLQVYNLKGQMVRSISISPTDGEYKWDAKDSSGSRLASGIYFINWQQGKHQGRSKILVLK